MITVKAAEFLVRYRVWNMSEFKTWAQEWCGVHKLPYHEDNFEMLYSHYRSKLYEEVKSNL
jgi:hypothetical protein